MDRPWESTFPATARAVFVVTLRGTHPPLRSTSALIRETSHLPVACVSSSRRSGATWSAMRHGVTPSLSGRTRQL